jgi:3-hydroxyisobutyrate dehydrogenase-like beta-hydroxyacid dehydrogenase
MGSAMAGNLARAGFEVQGYDVVAKRRSVDAISDIDAPVVITSLPSAEALHAVARELRHKCVVVETSTLPIEEKERARAFLENKGVVLLDCPLSGTARRRGSGPRRLRERRQEGVSESKALLSRDSRARTTTSASSATARR